MTVQSGPHILALGVELNTLAETATASHGCTQSDSRPGIFARAVFRSFRA